MQLQEAPVSIRALQLVPAIVMGKVAPWLIKIMTTFTLFYWFVSARYTSG